VGLGRYRSRWLRLVSHHPQRVVRIVGNKCIDLLKALWQRRSTVGATTEEAESCFPKSLYLLPLISRCHFWSFEGSPHFPQRRRALWAFRLNGFKRLFEAFSTSEASVRDQIIGPALADWRRPLNRSISQIPANFHPPKLFGFASHNSSPNNFLAMGRDLPQGSPAAGLKFNRPSANLQRTGRTASLSLTIELRAVLAHRASCRWRTGPVEIEPQTGRTPPSLTPG
jgi:hypothetical protein